VCNAYVERVFSIINCYWGNEGNKSSVNLIKSEIAVKINYKYTSKDIYTFVLKENDILESITSSKKYLFKLKQ
jgi:hypothetical protein